MELTLKLTIRYELNGETPKAMEDHLESAVAFIFGQGLITGETPAEVDQYSFQITRTEAKRKTCVHCDEVRELLPGDICQRCTEALVCEACNLMHPALCAHHITT